MKNTNSSYSTHLTEVYNGDRAGLASALINLFDVGDSSCHEIMLNMFKRIDDIIEFRHLFKIKSNGSIFIDKDYNFHNTLPKFEEGFIAKLVFKDLSISNKEIIDSFVLSKITKEPISYKVGRVILQKVVSVAYVPTEGINEAVEKFISNHKDEYLNSYDVDMVFPAEYDSLENLKTYYKGEIINKDDFKGE